MRNLVVATAVAAVAFSGLALADAKQDFTLVNKTGYELKSVFVSPSKADDWQEDVLGQDSLANGNAVNIHFNPKTNACVWDLKVIYTDDNSSAVWTKINLCEVEKIQIFYDRQNDVTKATFD